MEEQFQVGIITSTHGLKGEVKVFPTTDDKERFKELTQVIMKLDSGIKVLHIQGVKFARNMVVLKFKEFQHINEVEQYKGNALFVTREQAVPLKEGEYYRADLIGLKVITEDGKAFGILADIMETGANDVYVVKTEDGQEVLLPAIKECILDINLEVNQITIHLMAGLI